MVDMRRSSKLLALCHGIGRLLGSSSLPRYRTPGAASFPSESEPCARLQVEKGRACKLWDGTQFRMLYAYARASLAPLPLLHGDGDASGKSRLVPARRRQNPNAPDDPYINLIKLVFKNSRFIPLKLSKKSQEIRQNVHQKLHFRFLKFFSFFFFRANNNQMYKKFFNGSGGSGGGGGGGSGASGGKGASSGEVKGQGLW